MLNKKALDEFAEDKRAITGRVKAIGITATIPMTGSRNYMIEADGTIIMQYADVRRSLNRWRKREWELYAEDCATRNLWVKLGEITE